MKRLSHALAIAGAAALLPTLAHAQFSGKVGLFSEYEYRGISQTHEKPALQLNLDYAHPSGFYAGTFVSNIEWLKEAARAGGFSTSAKIEWDLYAGFRTEVAQGLTLDVGYLRYEYPSSGAFDPSPNTDEIYAGLTYGAFNVKYSHVLSDELFGVANAKNSYFIEANLAYPIPGMDKLTLTGHLGHQEYENNDFFSYNVWKVGAVYDFGGGLNAGAYYKGTDAEDGAYLVNGKDWSKERLVAFVTYSF